MTLIGPCPRNSWGHAAAILLGALLTGTALFVPAAPARAASSGTVETPPDLPAADPIRDGLRALHQGLFGQAEDAFRAASRAAPDDPEPLLFVAFSRWWRIVLGERGRGADDEHFDAALGAALEAGERRVGADPGDARAQAALGTAHILRSHVEALRRSYFHAAQEARRGKRLLEAALEKDPRLTDALFALGALNYYADRVPAIVKGIRALLFLPGGDADRGLDQLRAVAVSDGHFRTDARLLLALICAGRDEGCYRGALGQLQAALRDNPGSPLILASLGEIQARLGLYDEAARSYEQALEGASGGGPDRARQRRALRVALADALLADWRIERAARVLLEPDGDPGPEPAGVLKARARVTRDLAIRRGEIRLASARDGRSGAEDPVEAGDDAPGPAPADAGVLRAALRAQEEGRLSEALGGLDAAAAARPGDPLTAFLRGRILFLLDRRDGAAAALAEARDGAADPPPWMAGWIELYLGMIDAGRGATREARAHFRRAAEIHGFRSAERAVLELAPEGNPRSHCPAPDPAVPPNAARPVTRTGS